MSPDDEIASIKRETFEQFKNSRRVWLIEERGGEFIVHNWSGNDGQYGAGVGPPSRYPTLRKAAARLLQLLQVGAVAPQTWPENVCIGTVTMDSESGAEPRPAVEPA